MSNTIFTREHKNLIKKLKKARKDASLEQAQVGRLIDKTQSYVSKVEAGQRRIDIVSLKKFARIYKKSIDYFLE